MTLIIVIGFLLMIIGGFYLSIKYGHRLRRIKARRNCQICLVLDGSELKDIHLTGWDIWSVNSLRRR